MTLAFAALSGQSQYLISQGGTLSACSGTITDDGGPTGPYSNNSFTITICPDTPGDVVRLDFTEFNLQQGNNNANSDRLFIYDGPNVNASNTNPDGYSGTSLQGLAVTATVANISGCITLSIVTAGGANVANPGFSAIISCTTPCENPVAGSAFVSPQPEANTNNVVIICPGEEVTVAPQGSFAMPGFNISSYSWNFGDGTVINTTTPDPVSYTYPEAGAYSIILTIFDDNNCRSNNIEQLQVFNSTTPIFTGVGDIITSTCVGETVDMSAGNFISPTWYQSPPATFVQATFLADNQGFTYQNPITFDFFEAGAVLESCDQLEEVFMNIEHSWFGDLIFFLECPNGTIVNLNDGNNGGASSYFGEAFDDFGTADEGLTGLGYDYAWSQTATNGTMSQNTGSNSVTFVDASGATVTNDILPAGTYQPEGNLCDLVGCPLNGTWTLNITDDQGSDNGNLFNWGINFDPALYPDLLSFTPTIGINADSSYWTGSFITNLSPDGDSFVLAPTAGGTWDYTYHVINNFGCSFDTTISVTFVEPPTFTAGADFQYTCGNVAMPAAWDDLPPATCSASAGTFDFCYTNNQQETWVFCPDNIGDGTMMTFGFEAGTTETNFDYFWVYNGPDNSYPLLEGNIDGALAGLSWQSSDVSGCLTVVFDADGSNSCANAQQTAITYTVACVQGAPDFTWEWTPAIALTNGELMNPDLVNLQQTTTFTLTGYPTGHPACAASDDVTVNIDPLGDPGLDTYYPICPGGSTFSMLNSLNGTPVNYGTWTDPTGAPLADDIFDPNTDAPGMYTYTVAFNGCEASAVLNIDFPDPVTFVMPADTALCFGSDVNLHVTSLLNGAPPLNFSWIYNGLNVGSSPSFLYTPDLTGTACLEVTDQCGTVTTDCYEVTVEQPLDLQFYADTTAACWPFTFDITNLADESLYESSTWTFGDGTTITNRETAEISFEMPGSYSVQLFVVSPIGCQYEVSQDNYLTAFAPPLADWSADPNPTNVENTEVHFTDLSQGEELNYTWTFNIDGAQIQSTEQNPVYVFPQGIGGEYTVNLKVTDLNGCTDTWESIVVVNELFQSFVPTAFTPNYDGVNDEWKFVGTDIDETRFSLQIFDRWGGPIFQTNDPNQGWMGQKENGESYFVQDLVYPWKAVVVSKSTGERKELTGTITIIR